MSASRIGIGGAASRFMVGVMAASMALYISKVTVFSPMYAVYLVVMPATVVYVLYNLPDALPWDSSILLIMLLLMSALNGDKIISGEYINLLLGVNSYVYVRALREKFLPAYWETVGNRISVTVVILLFADSIYRLTHPTLPSREAMQAVSSDQALWFYPYKFGSIMFADSNTTGLVAMIALFLVLAMRSRLRRPAFRWDAWALCVIVCFSFSRSAIVATAIGLLFFYAKHFRARFKWAGGVLAVLVLGWVGWEWLFSLFESQGSLLSKLYILDIVSEHVFSADIGVLLFGIGLGESIDFFGIYTHSIYFTYLIEGGAFSFLLFIAFLAYYATRNGLVIILPFLVASISYFFYFGAPFLFLPLALFANLVDVTRFRLGKVCTTRPLPA